MSFVEVLDYFRRNLPPGCAITGQPIGEPCRSIYDQEEAALVDAVEKRRREFRAGRLRAREALATLGCPPLALPVGPGGAPLWPEGFTGSIAHSDEFAMAVAAPKSVVARIGVDFEDASPLSTLLIPFICTVSELHRLARTDGPQPKDAKLFFVAKESVLKAVYSESAARPDFLDVEIRFLPKSNAFSARGQSPLSRMNSYNFANGRGIFVQTRSWLAAAFFVLQ